MKTSDLNINNEGDLSSLFESYRKKQLEPVEGYSKFSYTSKKNRRKKKKKLLTVAEAKRKFTNDDNKVEPLPAELLEKLEDNTDCEQPKKVKSKKKKKNKIIVTSSVVDDNYIPLEAGCSTNFSLVRLDKKETLSYASTALDFYNKNLYGKKKARVPADTIIRGLKKTEAKASLAKRLK